MRAIGVKAKKFRPRYKLSCIGTCGHPRLQIAVGHIAIDDLLAEVPILTPETNPPSATATTGSPDHAGSARASAA